MNVEEDGEFVKDAFVSSRKLKNLVMFKNCKVLPQSFVAEVDILNDEDVVVGTYFFKKTCLENLKAKTKSEKDDRAWRVTLNSFINEYQFFKNVYHHMPTELKIPKCVACAVTSFEMSSKDTFRFLFERLPIGTELIEKQTMNLEDAERVIIYLGRFHMFFKNNAQFVHILSNQGGWWRKSLRPSVRFNQLVKTFEHLISEFPKEFSILDNEENRMLMQKIEFSSIQDEFYTSIQKQTDYTFIHGDVKTSNIFLSKTNDSVLFIDFQWIGLNPGSGLADVIYFIFGGVLPSSSSFDKKEEEGFESMKTVENKLLKKYGEIYPIDQNLYALELLDYFSTAVPYLLGELTPSILVSNLSEYGFLTYEFNAQALVYFFQRALESAKFLKL